MPTRYRLSRLTDSSYEVNDCSSDIVTEMTYGVPEGIKVSKRDFVLVSDKDAEK